ncbi:hypothetical protein KJ671_03065 [Patescibacteria group bacterium]|nr:hypothetical protein [Patescibacteria group bacterium]
MKKQKFISISLSVLFSFLGVFVVAYGATVISTNITTGGTLDVTGASTLTSATLSTTLDVTGDATFVNASTTGMLTVANGFISTASSSIASTFSIAGTLGVTGVSTLTGNVILTTASSTGQVKLDNLVVGEVSLGVSISSAGAISASSTLDVTGDATFVNASTTGMLTIANGLISTASTSIADTLSVVGKTTMVNASTTAISASGSLRIGNSGAPLTKIVAGYCTIATLSPTASSTAVADCTPNESGLIAEGDIVMVMATGSLPVNFSISGASSTATNIIGVEIYNHGYDSTAATGIHSFNFIAITK